MVSADATGAGSVTPIAGSCDADQHLDARHPSGPGRNRDADEGAQRGRAQSDGGESKDAIQNPVMVPLVHGDLLLIICPEQLLQAGLSLAVSSERPLA